MRVHLLANLGATMVVDRHHDGRVIVLVDVDQPQPLILALSRVLLGQAEREELAHALSH